MFPRNFPVKAYDGVNDHVSRCKADKSPVEYNEFSGGWNGIGYRFLLCKEQNEAYSASIAKSVAPKTSERLKQERALYIFMVSGFSTLECMSYALYALGAMLDPTEYSLIGKKKLRNINFELTRKTFAKRFRKEAVTLALDRISNDPKFNTLNAARNILLHRTQPARTIFAGGAKDGTAEWKLGTMQLNIRTTASLYGWLSVRLTETIEETLTFAKREFSLPP